MRQKNDSLENTVYIAWFLALYHPLLFIDPELHNNKLRTLDNNFFLLGD